MALVRGVNAEGRAEYRSVIAVSPDSPIRSVEGLRGKRFAFGGVMSTQGHLIPRIAMSEHNITLDALGSYEFTGSHMNAASAVIQGRADACGMQDVMGERLAAQGLLRIIHRSRYHPSSGIVANVHVPPDVRNSVKQALLEFDPEAKDAAGLYHWERTEMPKGFVEAKKQDYDELREWASQLGFYSGVPE